MDTIVAEVQGVAGDDRCVILLSYEDQLKDMFQNMNLGLHRRFDFDNSFRFENFNQKQLMEILDLMMQQDQLPATPNALRVASEV